MVLDPNSKLSIPLLTARKGKISVRPSDDYEFSKVIQRVDSDLYTSDSLYLSGVDGIYDKDSLTKVDYANKGKIELGFIPLYCKSITNNKPFYCALTVKKIANSNPVRRVEQVKNEGNVIEKGLIGYKKKIAHSAADDNENIDEEFNLEASVDETQLIITSIISFTNALPKEVFLKT